MLKIEIYTDDREEASLALEEIADLIRCGKEPIRYIKQIEKEVATIKWG